ncbi:MAG: hypothetical protein JO051_04765 [Acidobacteriaceae bacterium]|nr:hypothetical protein [Acidobacteriaceae bacterium]
MTVREASIEWISLALQRAQPDAPQQAARTEAEKLVELAEEQDIGIERIVDAINRHGTATHARCAHCGAEIHSLQEAAKHRCAI